MAIYSVDKLTSEARRLAREYRQATGKTLPITGEIAINDAVRLLNLNPAKTTDSGFDALFDYQGKTIPVQIKGRVIFNETKSGHRLGQLKIEQDWDAVLLVMMDENFDSSEIYIAHRQDILDVMGKSKNKKGSITVARFKIIGDLLWTRENGLEDDGYWSNN